MVMNTDAVDCARADPDRELESPARVLIVDDAASTRRLLRGVLEYCPHFDVAGEADNGATAIEMAEVLQPDVILLDLSMPVIDGSTALGDLVRVAPNARVIVLSAMKPKAATSLLATGATAFIPKQLPPFELLERLGSILGLPVALPRTTPADTDAAVPALPDDVLDQRIVGSLRAFGGDPGQLLQELVHDFLIDAPSLMTEIERAVEENAYVIAARAAHRLKGGSEHMGALRLAVVAGEIETSARSGVRRATASATETARAELGLAVAAARALLS